MNHPALPSPPDGNVPSNLPEALADIIHRAGANGVFAAQEFFYGTNPQRAHLARLSACREALPEVGREARRRGADTNRALACGSTSSTSLEAESRILHRDGRMTAEEESRETKQEQDQGWH